MFKVPFTNRSLKWTAVQKSFCTIAYNPCARSILYNSIQSQCKSILYCSYSIDSVNFSHFSWHIFMLQWQVQLCGPCFIFSTIHFQCFWKVCQWILTLISSLGYAVREGPVGGLGFSRDGFIDDSTSTGSSVRLNSFSSSAAFLISSCSRSENCYKQTKYVSHPYNSHSEKLKESWVHI